MSLRLREIRIPPISDFLGEESSLEQVVSRDEELLRENGISVEVLGNYVIQMHEFIEQGMKSFSLHSQDFVIEKISLYSGKKYSPFGDGSSSSYEAYIKNTTNGETLFFPGLLAHLISKHHFFEGKGSRYRIEPLALAQFFGLIK